MNTAYLLVRSLLVAALKHALDNIFQTGIHFDTGTGVLELSRFDLNILVDAFGWSNGVNFKLFKPMARRAS
jgi:hypothetical protein